jgi:hypothetical protein
MIADELESWHEKVSIEEYATKLDGGTKEQLFHFVHGFCKTFPRI